MIKQIIRNVSIFLFILAIHPTGLFAINIINADSVTGIKINDSILPAIEITGNFITPEFGIDKSDARRLIISRLKKGGTVISFDSLLELNEITIKESWENIGVQIYRINLEYAWINSIAIVKNKEVITILRGNHTKAVFLADLDNDNKYEIYSNVSIGSGMISEEVLGYNIALNESYHLSMRGEKDIDLYVEERILMSKVYPYNSKPDCEGTILKKVVLKGYGNKKVLEIEK